MFCFRQHLEANLKLELAEKILKIGYTLEFIPAKCFGQQFAKVNPPKHNFDFGRSRKSCPRKFVPAKLSTNKVVQSSAVL